MRVGAWRVGAMLALIGAVAATQTQAAPAAAPTAAKPAVAATPNTGKPPPKIPPPATPAAQHLDPNFNTDTGRAWIAAMKNSSIGPFSRIRYFCSDGQILEPKAFICEPFGGGYQHGEWNAQTLKLRAAGFPIANLLVTVAPEQVTGADADPDLLAILVIERFLISYDDGWIYRKAQFYRGAIQDHNEKEAARSLLAAITADKDLPYLQLREATRSFPHGADTPSLSKVRSMAVVLDDKDHSFHPLRSRIHNSPEAADAARVRAYAMSSTAKPELKAGYQELVDAIDAAYQPPPLSMALARLKRYLRDEKMQDALQALVKAQTAAELPDASFDARLKSSADILVWLRDSGYAAIARNARVAVLDVSLDAEQTFMVAASQALPTMPNLTREQRLAWLAPTQRALYGMGLLTDRESQELAENLESLSGKVGLTEYRSDLEYLERASAWCGNRLGYTYGNGLDRLRPIEPQVEAFVPDRLRASPLLFYSSVLQSLRVDADKVSGVSQQMFGDAAGGGLRRLNPGIARGVLRTSLKDAGAGSEPAIFLVPETTSDLPAAAGILTEAEGNPVSHVQLLARNLGIPNVVVSRDLIPKLAPYNGKKIVVAASSGGLVEIAEDSAKWDEVLGQGAQKPSVVIVPDLVKLNLLRADFVSTATLRASDSGRICGPKAAHVGELTHRFPDNVSPGLAVTFGIYRELLNEPVKAGGPAMFEWMKQQYAEIAVRRRLDPSKHALRVNTFLDFTRDWIAKQPLPPALMDRMRGAMLARFGMEGTYGVFVRSDTNIEDLPGFTGAGLNLTIPNLVGFDNTVKALRQVWASPFTERAYGWRQDLMDQPEHVYVSVLLHQSVRNEKSGVMITADVDTGKQDTLTVATSLGVGGGVDGEASEALHIEADDGKAKLFASATAREMRVLPVTGGAKMIAAAAPDAVLTQDEIDKLAKFARRLPKEYVELHDDEGHATPADIEFGFVKGRLMLQQIRPFLQNRSASRQTYLQKMDAQLRKNDSTKVDLDDKPEVGS
jgi:phosphohistidine swiveling domain-containing protein